MNEGNAPQVEEAFMIDDELEGEPSTIDEVEAANPYPADGRVPDVPFGFGNDGWQRTLR